MSGPKTVVLSPLGLPILLAAAGVQALTAIQEGNARAKALEAEHRDQTSERSSTQQAAREHALGAARSEIAAAEARLDSLMTLAIAHHAEGQIAAARPLPPAVVDVFALAGYAAGLKAYVASVELILLQESARLKTDSPLDDPQLDAAQRGHIPQRTAARLLARIAHLGDVPIDIRQLAEQLDSMLPGERALLLAAELRHKIQAYLDDTQARMLEEATATVIAKSLRDLGYQVEDIPNTLFIDGGIAHFQRPGWGDYMVRMRIPEKGGTANFNVVRATDASDTEITAMDHLAEDRWCAEFPTLLKKLEAEGIHMQVTRHLAAGELPVQLVDRARLPAFQSEEDQQSEPSALMRPIR